VFVGLLAVTLGGCRDDEPPKLPKTPQSDVAGATDRQTTLFVEGAGRPLIVDWQPEQRGDLEVAMKEGVAIVSYGRDGLRLLSGCRIDGNYGFIGINKKEQIIRLISEDEIKANLPLSGPSIAASLGGELAQGASLDIAMVMVGQRRTTWNDVTRADLKGRCEGATHFVRGATIGAFAMTAGQRDRVRTAAELFGAGLSASSNSSASLSNRDGALEECNKADPDARDAPSQCGALIRLELLPINDVAAARTSTEQVAASQDEPGCPTGFVYADGKCTQEQGQGPHHCKPGDAAECATQCGRGSAQSCDALGYLLATGTGGVQRNVTKAAEMFAASCRGDFGNGCLNLGTMFESGQGVAKDEREAAGLYLQSCRLGFAKGCSYLGRMFYAGKGVAEDYGKAIALFVKGCDGGDREGCNDAGFMALAGMGVPKNEALAANMVKRACDGGVSMGCANYGYVLEFGKGVRRDVNQAAAFYDRSCRADATECIWMGVVHELGKGVPKDASKAAEYYIKSCDAGYKTACALLSVLLKKPYDFPVDELALTAKGWIGQCNANTERDCSLLGVLALYRNRKNVAAAAAGRGCLLGDEWGCAWLARMGAPRPKNLPPTPTLADFGL
jgi:hypothetical protein